MPARRNKVRPAAPLVSQTPLDFKFISSNQEMDKLRGDDGELYTNQSKWCTKNIQMQHAVTAV